MAQKYVPATAGYDIEIGPLYGIDYTDYATVIADNYANRALAAIDLPGLDAYWTFQEIANANFDTANLMAMAYLPGAVTDALALSDGYIGQGVYPDDGITSRGNIILPHGGYKVNFPCQYAHGSLKGRGSANYTNSQVQVFGAGTGAINGDYNRTGSLNNRPLYTLVGGAVDDTISWSGAAWIISEGGVSMYSSTDDVTYPHKVTTWTTTGGAGPVPTVQRPSASATTPGTQIIIDHDYWLSGCMADRNCLQSTTWGDMGLSGYTEGSVIEGIRCDGAVEETASWIADPGHYDPTYQSSGIAIWSAGSTSVIRDCFCRNFNDFGILLANASTPATLDNVCVFLNQMGGVGIIGGGTVRVFGIEADDNPAIFYVREGYAVSPAAVDLHVFGVKSETGPAPARPYPKGQCVLDSEAWTCAVFVGVKVASVNSYPDILFRIKTTANSSSLDVSGLGIFDYYRTLLHDVSNAKKWLVDMGEDAPKWFSAIHSFKWVSNDGGRMVTDFVAPLQVNNCAENRLDWLLSGSTPSTDFDDVAGSPAYVL